jgi:hypothetical protein
MPIAMPKAISLPKNTRRRSSSSSSSGSPLSYIEAILRRKTGSGSSGTLPTWSDNGYEVLPPSARFCLTKLKVSPASVCPLLPHQVEG